LKTPPQETPPAWFEHGGVSAKTEPIISPCIYLRADRPGPRALSRADEYRLRAKTCLEMASAFREREARIALSHMAQAWLRLADRYQDVGKSQPAFQQQQQVQAKQVTMARQGWPKTDPVMPSHKFRVGESVTLIPSISRNVAGGIYQVIRQLPHNGRDFEYQIKSANEHTEQHQRVAREIELARL